MGRRTVDYDPEKIRTSGSSLLLYNPRSVRNFGSAVRVCACLNAQLLYFDGYYPDEDSERTRLLQDKTGTETAIQVSTMRAWYNTRKIRIPPDRDIADVVRKFPYVIAATTGEDTKSAHKLVFPEDVLIMLGSEITGFPEHVLRLANQRVKIPMAHPQYELNVSMAGFGMLQLYRLQHPLSEK